MVLAKAAGVYRSQNNDSQRASRRNSKPKTKGLWDLVLETESTASKGREVGKSELGIQTVEHSNVRLFPRPVTQEPLFKMFGYKLK